jgi:threonyl-tRNA synthetase
VYRSRQRSYRELPMRLFEFGTVYRYELSGVVHGLMRVRGLTMDDSHIFCTDEQLPGELQTLLAFVLDMLRQFGLNDFYLELSTRPEDKAIGTDEEWERATDLLRAAGDAAGLELVLDEGGGAFYGPKISVQAKDAIGRSHQVSTIQLDFQEPQRFGLEYVGSDNVRHRPVMIHRALFGSVERFMAILLEHYAGNLPTWLMPEQVRVLPVKEDVQPYAESVTAELAGAGLRATIDPADSGVGARVARAKTQKIPYVLVVGDQDVAQHTVGINRRGTRQPERAVPLSEFLSVVTEEVATRAPGPQPADDRE